MSQSEKKRIQSNGESLETESSQNAVGQDTLKDPILSKESNKTRLVGIDQTAVSGQPEDKGKYNHDEEPSMKVSNVDTVLPKKDLNMKKQHHSSVNSFFQGLRSAYEDFEKGSQVEKQSEEKNSEEKK